MYLLFQCICPHKSSMGHLFRRVSLFSFQIPHKSSMGHLFRCGSSVLLLSGLTQVLYGSLVSVWIICSSFIRSRTSPLLGRLFSSLYVRVHVHVCMCMCIESLCREITPPATLLQWEVKAIFVVTRMPLTRLSKCFASSRSDAVDLALRLHSIAVNPVIDPHSP